jgi:hypothetical protein
MVKYKEVIFVALILFFLAFSFYPTVFDLSKARALGDPNREHILEHNFYWPDYNLYLSKIRQGFEGHFLAAEKYTSELHQGSLIQEFYVVLGLLGRILDIDPNLSYQLGRLLFSPLLLLIILMLTRFYFKSFKWQIAAFIIIIVSGSFPRFYQDAQGTLQIGRFMEWWSNIDALQRITFIPHILFGQVISFYLLYKLTIKQPGHLTIRRLVVYILLGNLTGLVFPPSLITLIGVISLIIILRSIIKFSKNTLNLKAGGSKEGFPNEASLGITDKSLVSRGRALEAKFGIPERQDPQIIMMIFILLTLPSLLYIFFLTKQIPWSALVDFHRTHPMMIPFWQYILGTGPIFFLGIAGAIVSIVKRQRQFQPLIFWVLTTFAFAVFFTHFREQSPLRFTQTGLFIPLGILGAYLFYELYHLSNLGHLSHLFRPTIPVILSLYILGSFYMMTVSLKWQTTWITQRVRATMPAVPYPPQTMFPLTSWMDGIRWLRDHTDHNDVVLAEITAASHIPAYSGNTVYFGQANTVDYEIKQQQVWNFFEGKMTASEAQNFIQRGRIKYVFYSIQEKEKSQGLNLETVYPFLKPVFNNQTVTIYKLE